MPGDGEVPAHVLDDWIARGWPQGRPPWTREVFEEHYRWEKELEAKQRAESLTDRKLTELGARLSHIERLLLSKDRRRLSEPLIDVLADAIAEICGDIIDQRALLSYRGLWDEATAYRAGDVVTYAGGAWTAVAETKDERVAVSKTNGYRWRNRGPAAAERLMGGRGACGGSPHPANPAPSRWSFDAPGCLAQAGGAA